MLSLRKHVVVDLYRSIGSGLLIRNFSSRCESLASRSGCCILSKRNSHPLGRVLNGPHSQCRDVLCRKNDIEFANSVSKERFFLSLTNAKRHVFVFVSWSLSSFRVRFVFFVVIIYEFTPLAC